MRDLPIEPMLADSGAVQIVGAGSEASVVGGQIPSGDEWQFEFKWDGVRIIAVWHEHELALYSRNGNDVTASWPEVAALGPLLGDHTAILDGEVVVMGEGARPDFGLLQERIHVRNPAEVAQLAARLPATLLLFDVVWFGGHDVRSFPLSQRRALLEELDLDGPAWKVPPAFVGDGPATLDAARALGLEGVVAKRRSSTYQSGRRSDAWRKFKLVHRDEFVVCGWTPGAGRREGTVGALVLGAHDPDDGSLVHVGSVGSGFDDRATVQLEALLEASEVAATPFEVPLELAGVRWCQPLLVCEVQYSGWTREGRLRHPSYYGIRADKEISEVVVPR